MVVEGPMGTPGAAELERGRVALCTLGPGGVDLDAPPSHALPSAPPAVGGAVGWANRCAAKTVRR